MNCVWSPGCCNRINHGCRAGLLGNLVTRWVGGSTQEPRLDKHQNLWVINSKCSYPGSYPENCGMVVEWGFSLLLRRKPHCNSQCLWLRRLSAKGKSRASIPGLASRGRHLRWLSPSGFRHMGQTPSVQSRACDQKVTFGPKAWSAGSEALPGVRSVGHQVILMSFVGGNSVESAKRSRVKTLM